MAGCASFLGFLAALAAAFSAARAASSWRFFSAWRASCLCMLCSWAAYPATSTACFLSATETQSYQSRPSKQIQLTLKLVLHVDVLLKDHELMLLFDEVSHLPLVVLLLSAEPGRLLPIDGSFLLIFLECLVAVVTHGVLLIGLLLDHNCLLLLRFFGLLDSHAHQLCPFVTLSFDVVCVLLSHLGELFNFLLFRHHFVETVQLLGLLGGLEPRVVGFIPEVVDALVELGSAALTILVLPVLSLLLAHLQLNFE